MVVRPVGLNAELTVDVEPLCECPCMEHDDDLASVDRLVALSVEPRGSRLAASIFLTI